MYFTCGPVFLIYLYILLVVYKTGLNFVRSVFFPPVVSNNKLVYMCSNRATIVTQILQIYQSTTYKKVCFCKNKKTFGR